MYLLLSEHYIYHSFFSVSFYLAEEFKICSAQKNKIFTLLPISPPTEVWREALCHSSHRVRDFVHCIECKSSKHKDRKCRYNVTLWRVRVNTVSMVKQQCIPFTDLSRIHCCCEKIKCHMYPKLQNPYKTFTLEQIMKTKRGSRSISTLSLTSALDGGGWPTSFPRPLYPRERDPITIVQEVGWVPGPVWNSVENVGCTGIRFPESPARSESLYWLSYPGPRSSLIDCCICCYANRPKQ